MSRWRQFPKAQPSKGMRRANAPYRWRAHQYAESGQADWTGEGLCEICGFRKTHRVHDVQVSDDASVIDARRLGENQ